MTNKSADSSEALRVSAGAQESGDDNSAGLRGFFMSTGFPLFLLTAALVYEAFLVAVVFAPETTSAWGGFAREFKQWCFRYDPRSGGMEWAAVWVMLVEPAFVVGVAAYLWRRALRPLRGWAGWRRHHRAAFGGAAAAGVAMAALFAYGQPSADADAPLPFPGERIRTRLAVPPFSFTDQKGQPFALEQHRGRVVIVTGIYAMCSTSCPEILLETKRLMDSLPADLRARVSVVAVSLNPEDDTLDLMTRMTEGYGFTHPDFRYVNGDPAGMNEILPALGFARSRNPRTMVIDHANLFLLLDANGEIAYRLTLDERHRPWLREAVVALAREATGS